MVDATVELKKIDERYELSLPCLAKKALQRHDPSFETWTLEDYLPSAVKEYEFTPRQSLFAAIGDFNGDDVLDVCLHGHNRENDLILAVLSSVDEYTVVEVLRGSLTDPKTERYGMGGDKFEYGLWAYLVSASAGTRESHHEEKPLTLDTDSFQVVAWGKAARLYYFSDDKFLEYVTAD